MVRGADYIRDCSAAGDGEPDSQQLLEGGPPGRQADAPLPGVAGPGQRPQPQHPPTQPLSAPPPSFPL